MDNTNEAEQAAPETEAGQALAANQEVPESSSGETPQSGEDVGTEQNETPSEGQSQEAEEKLLAGKFKSQEDLEKAYKELESHNKKVEMERSDLEKLFVEKETDSTPVDDAPTKESPKGEIDNALEQLEPKLAETVSKMLAKPLAKLEVQDMLNKYGDDFKAKAKQVAEKQKHNPSLSMEDAFKLVSFDNVKRTSYQQGVEKTSQNFETKKKAQVESSRPSGYRPESLDDAVKRIGKDTSVEDVADALGPEYEIFKQTTQRRKG